MRDRLVIAAVVALGLGLGAGGCSFDGGGVVDVDASGGQDGDGDGVDDAVDNCVELANADQRDEDGDDVGNACDNCPHVVNADQANAGETGAGVATDDAGDACDPDPAGAGNDRLYFDGFDDPGSLDDWRAFNGGNWSISGGALRQSDPGALHTLYLATLQFQGVHIAARFTVDALQPSAGPSDTNRAFATLVGYSTAAGEGAGYLCLAYHNPASVPTTTGTLNIITLRGSGALQVEGSVLLGQNLEEGAAYDLQQSMEVSTGALTCGVSSSALPAPVAVSGNDGTYDAGFLAVKTQYVGGHFDYVVAFAVPAPP